MDKWVKVIAGLAVAGAVGYGLWLALNYYTAYWFGETVRKAFTGSKLGLISWSEQT